MTGQESNRGLVQASSSVDVDCVRDVFGWFCLVNCRVQRFVLASWGEEQAPVRSECQSSEERCESLVKIDGCIANTERANAVHARRVRHDCGQRH